MIYMMSDNDLDVYSSLNINQLESSIDSKVMDIYVFIDRMSYAPSKPSILKIVYDNSSEIYSPIVKQYEEFNSASSERLSDFINYVKSKSGASNVILGLWSHGYGWFSSPYIIKPKYIGVDKTDGENYLAIPELVKALPDNFVDIVIFDACEVADAEIAYELKGKSQYLISSQTEVLATGMPYNRYINSLKIDNSTRNHAINIGEIFFDYYDNQSNPVNRSATISVIDINNIESLYNQFLDIIVKIKDDDRYLAIINSQKTTRLAEFKNYRVDMLDFINNINIDNQSKDNFVTSFNDAVVFNRHTKFLLNSLELKNINGLNIFIPLDNTSVPIINDYKKLQWGRWLK